MSKNILYDKKKFFKNTIWVSKNAEFDADFESVQKVAKNSREKIYPQKASSFPFYDTHNEILGKKTIFFAYISTTC